MQLQPPRSSRPPEQTQWKPILEGPAAIQARIVLASILSDLKTITLESPTIIHGSAGVALLFGYQALIEPETEGRQTAIRLLSEALDQLSKEAGPASLYHGFPGVAWVIQHLQNRMGDFVDADPCLEVDEILLEQLDPPNSWNDCSLMEGLSGLGLYALERLQAPLGPTILRKVIKGLAESAERDRNGVTWRIPAGLLRSDLPPDQYNLGLAHGTSAVVGFLGRVCASGVDGGMARGLLEEAVHWLFAHADPDGTGPCFPAVFVKGCPPPGAFRSRMLRWCYGDLGTGAAILGAGRSAGYPDWERTLHPMLRRCARLGIEASQVEDAPLCHGASGVAHIFNRLHQFTGDPELGEAARTWFGHTISFWNPGEGPGGFRSWKRARDGEEGCWVDLPSFLNGSAGIGLAIQAALTDVAPTWDRLLGYDLGL